MAVLLCDISAATLQGVPGRRVNAIEGVLAGGNVRPLRRRVVFTVATGANAPINRGQGVIADEEGLGVSLNGRDPHTRHLTNDLLDLHVRHQASHLWHLYDTLDGLKLRNLHGPLDGLEVGGQRALDLLEEAKGGEVVGR